MPIKRIDTGIGGLDPTESATASDTAENALSDAPENANEEFGRGDQEFGGGRGVVEYGDEKIAVGTEGIVAERSAIERPLVTPDEKEGVVLPGSDDSEDVDDELDEAE